MNSLRSGILSGNAKKRARAGASDKVRREWLRRVEEEYRSAAITQGLDNLRRAQNAQGYGLRGDIAAAEQMMQADIARAQTALEAGNGAQAKEYLDKADAQASIIERFQGR